MAGLLDFEDPNTVGALQFGMGLLNAGGPSRMPVSLGQGIAQAGTGALDSMRQVRADLLKKKLADLEIEKGQMTLDQAKAELAADKAFMEAMKNPKVAAAPYGGGYSPAVAGAFGVPQSAPQSSPQRNSDALLQAAKVTGSRKMYEAALKMALEEKKLDPKFGTTPQVVMGPNGPVLVQTADDGTVRPIQGGYGPAEKAHFADTGGKIQAMNPFTGAPLVGGGVAKSLTPDQAATLPIQWKNANTSAGQLDLGKKRFDFESSPEQQGKVTTAKETAKKDVELSFVPKEAAAGAGKALEAAGYDPKTKSDNISKWLDNATGGFFGSTIDSIVGSTGFSMPGEQANAKLAAAANKIVMDMMGGKLGAQISNADVVFVKAQLGDVGNPNIPTETRRAAWNAAKERLVEIRKKGATGSATGEWSVEK